MWRGAFLRAFWHTCADGWFQWYVPEWAYAAAREQIFSDESEQKKLQVKLDLAEGRALRRTPKGPLGNRQGRSGEWAGATRPTKAGNPHPVMAITAGPPRVS